jgi:type I site-specific restriction endonuclease
MLHWSHDPCPQTGDISEYLLRFKNKKDLSERDICSKFIGPAVKRAGWDGMMQIREEVAFTKGRIIVRGKLVTRGKAKRADYILYYKPNIPIAIIEAKDNNHSVGDGMQQALDYAAHFQFDASGSWTVHLPRLSSPANPWTVASLWS